MDYFMWATAILTIWAAVGPLVGVRYGQELARRNQKAQWVADSKKKEFKEVLNAMDVAMAAFAKHANNDKKTPDDFWDVLEMSNHALRCVSDRIFILPEMKKLDIQMRWFNAHSELERTGDIEMFSSTYKQMRLELIEAATADIKEYEK